MSCLSYLVSDKSRLYLAYPVLGARPRGCVEAISGLAGKGINEVLSQADAMKFRSCLMLSAAADGESSLFKDALQEYFSGLEDQRTLELLAFGNEPQSGSQPAP